MFTGIVEVTARVLEVTPSKLTIERPKSFTDLKGGSSVAVSGVCFTVVKLTKQEMAFDVTPETLRRTKTGSLKKGDRVNVERALKVSSFAPSERLGRAGKAMEDGGDRFEGHMVLGHVDEAGRVSQVRKVGQVGKGGTTLTVSYPKKLRGLIVEKGSIAVDGVSLTVASVDAQTFSVVLIPHTLKETTLGTLRKGDMVNLEADILGKYIRGIMKSSSSQNAHRGSEG